MEIKNAEFIKGIIGEDYTTKDDLPQIIFFGRSNSGKSSTINALVNRKNLAKSSKVPGKTREANFFKVNNKFYFIDFPGYGYVKGSIKSRDKIIKRILWYLENYQTKPKAIFLIIDIKVGLTSYDREIIDILNANNHNIFIVANKADKLNKKKIEEQIKIIKSEFDREVFIFSAKTKKGKDEILKKMEEII